MSAYIVSPEHIRALVQYAARPQYGSNSHYYYKGQPHAFTGNEDNIGQILTNENYRSVNYRHTENRLAPVYRHRDTLRTFTPVQIIKAVHCLDYQSCETPDWQDTEAYVILEAILDRATRELPGYEEAAWGIDY